ncbi:translation initiation factor eIF4E [Lobosporangium transversale]|uniref:Translation initiation factor eIF 4e-like domain-containing protein n=1 Tax=Lobosporangium transversale TaxID=64571 RepID=A0A1Y2GX93_9FUNG|nr:hypothetical protein BCR41DRAFT_419326 [Lobosporangium transversale]KAF9915755.1 translation initiation factor eIF4E [Lobosporangium transversale]ORZ26885.1 hypothetical protein BCR41DRAFT_419326 [Lobosporangium transversale]|eukprot:XP_021884632.1 hypothetical protein BCR41DRAFT_419326 [Lobosporangium transversale]
MSTTNELEKQQGASQPSTTSCSAAHDPIPPSTIAIVTSSASSNAAVVKAAMQARRKSRGLGDGLRPDFVFPKPQQAQAQTPSSSSAPFSQVNSNGLQKRLDNLSLKEEQSTSPATSITLSAPSDINSEAYAKPLSEGDSKSMLNQQHLKTHYRTHSRNGSTVTVQDIKQAIAAASTDLPPLAVLSNATNPSTTLGECSTITSVPSPNNPVRSETSSVPVSVEETTPPPLPPSSAKQDLVSQSDEFSRPDITKQYSSLDVVSEPSTPFRDSCSTPLFSPISSRSNSVHSNRTTRDRSNISAPPFFAYSIPHEFPSPYYSPRLFLPSATGPTSLPTSPFARKRKHAYHHTTVYYPTSTICVKLPGQEKGLFCAHHLPVGEESEFEHSEYAQDAFEQQAQAYKPNASNSVDVDKCISQASLVLPTASQPYRPPASRLRGASENKSDTNSTVANDQHKYIVSESSRLLQRASPISDIKDDTFATTDLSDSNSQPSVRNKKVLPPPLNLPGNNNVQDINKLAAESITPTTPSRRRHSKSHKDQKDKIVDGPQLPDADKYQTESLMSGDHQHVEDNNESQGGSAEQSKKSKARSRSRSRSRSRNHTHAGNSSGQTLSNQSVPPVPQTPSWVPAHKMTLGTGPSSATITTTSTSLSAPVPLTAPVSPSALSHSISPELPTSPSPASTSGRGSGSNFAESDLKRRGPRPARLLSTRSTSNLQTLSESGQATFSPRSARDGPSDYFSMRPLQHPPRTPMTPGGDYGDDDDDYYGRLQMVTTPIIQNGYFPNWAKGDAQLEELQRIRLFLAQRQYPDEMPLSDEWTLFFSDTSGAKDKTGVQDAYSSAITPLFSCHTVPQFATSWKYVRERVRPATMKMNQNLHWFKKGIKPMWEDPKNKYGGRLTLCPPKALLDIVWETVLILMAGDVLDLNGEGTGAVIARRPRGDRVEVWVGAEDTPEALAHIRGVLIQELAPSGADEVVRVAKYKKHFDSRKEEKMKQLRETAAATTINTGSTAGTSISSQNTPTSTNGIHSLSSPLPPMTPKAGTSGSLGSSTPSVTEFQTFEAFTQHQQQQRERKRERERETLKEHERIMQLGKERLEKERAEKERLRDEKVRAMAAAAMAASEAKHQQQLKEQRGRAEAPKVTLN